MSPTDDLSQMLHALEDVFASEGRPGGDEAAVALKEVTDNPFDLPPAKSLDTVECASDALKAGGHAAAPSILAELPSIDWHHSGLEDGRIRADIALSMATAELIVPNGMIFHPTVRVGLFMQVLEIGRASCRERV